MVAAKFQQEMLVTIYEIARTCNTDGVDSAIMAALNIGRETWFRWKKKKPQVADAFKRGRVAKVDRGANIHEYVYKRLPPEVKKIWDRIHALDGQKSAYAKIKQILDGEGTETQQMLFIHALLVSNFKTSRAMHMLCMPSSSVDTWNRDPVFQKLMRQVLEYKKDFFEDALFRLVKSGDPSAIIFVNRTLNKDRGYSEKHVVEVVGKIEHEHKLDVSNLNLSLEARKEVLLAMRAQKEKRIGGPKTPCSFTDDPDDPDDDTVDGEVLSSQVEEENVA